MPRVRVLYSVLQVKNVLAGLMHRDPDQRLSVRDFRETFASVGQLWGTRLPQGQQGQGHSLPSLPPATLGALGGLAGMLHNTESVRPEWIRRCEESDDGPFWRRS